MEKGLSKNLKHWSILIKAFQGIFRHLQVLIMKWCRTHQALKKLLKEYILISREMFSLLIMSILIILSLKAIWNFTDTVSMQKNFVLFAYQGKFFRDCPLTV